MSIKPIKSESEYESALEEIESLFSSKPGTDDFDRLEVLAVLVQDYERVHYPIALPDMQSAIEHELDKRGFTQQETDIQQEVSIYQEIPIGHIVAQH
jgi:HTH-type transcriptional regulator/antitoxin HigA